MPVVEFDFVPMGTMVDDPYAVYRKMRETGPLLRSPMGVLMIHRYGDVRTIHADHDHFSMAGIDVQSMISGGGQGTPDDELMTAPTMLTVDPPDHERLRRVVNRAFTPRSINAIEPRIRQIAQDLLAPLRAGDPFDLVADFAAPFPTIVISELLGVPSEDADQFRRWSEVMTGTDTGAEVSAETADRYGRELRHYLSDQIRLREAEPTDDLIGRMVVANEAQIMSHAEVVAACTLLLIAGNETTMRLISNMALALSRFPDQRARLVEDPALIPSGIEETLRYESPVQMTIRATRTDTVVDDVTIPQGELVLTMLAAANRDPDAFVDPDTFDVGRADNLHAAFGHGIHYCLGASLARREARVAIEELLAVAPEYERHTADEDLQYPPTAMLRSPGSLVIAA